MDASPPALIKGRSGGDRPSTSSQPSFRKSLFDHKAVSVSSFDSGKSTNLCLESPPQVSDVSGQHCVQFLTLLPHQEKLFYLNLFQRKKQYSSNPISHIEHRTKSHVFMEISAFDSPVCRIRICAREKRNIERVLELLDEYCPVLLKYSNHQELTRVRQSLLPISSPTSEDVRQSSSNKLPTLRRVPFVRRRDNLVERAKTAKAKVPRAPAKPEKADDEKTPGRNDDQKNASERTREQKAEDKKGASKESQNEEAKMADKEKIDNPSHSTLPESHEEKGKHEGDFEREKSLSSFDGDAVNNEVSVLSALESLMKSEREVLTKPQLPHQKIKGAEHKKTGTPVEICQELETVVEGYLEREREKVEKLKLEANAEMKTEQKTLEKFCALVLGSGKPRKAKKEKERKEEKAEAEEMAEKGDRNQPAERSPKTPEAMAGDEKAKKRKRKRRRATAGSRRDSRNK